MLLRGGRVELDASTQETIARYHALLADERDPEERGTGLTEYGTREARIESVRALGPDEAPRLQFLAGEPMALELLIASDAGVAAPRVSLELRDEAGLLLAAAAVEASEVGWTEGASRHTLRFDVERTPFADGRFRLRCELTDASGRHVYHWLDDAARFVFYPGREVRGPVLLDGRWSLQESGGPLETREGHELHHVS